MRHRSSKSIAIAAAVIGTALTGAAASSAEPAGAGAASDVPAAPVSLAGGQATASP